MCQLSEAANSNIDSSFWRCANALPHKVTKTKCLPLRKNNILFALIFTIHLSLLAAFTRNARVIFHIKDFQLYVYAARPNVPSDWNRLAHVNYLLWTDAKPNQRAYNANVEKKLKHIPRGALSTAAAATVTATTTDRIRHDALAVAHTTRQARKQFNSMASRAHQPLPASKQ